MSGRSCPACGARTSPWRDATPSDPALRGGRYPLERCEACGSAITTGPGAPRGAHETSYYEPTRGLADRLIEPLRRLADLDKLRILRGIEPGARVLEVGSGDGRLLRRLAERGAVVSGIEPSAGIEDRSPRDGVPVFAGPIEDAPAPAEPLLAAIAWHSLEHVNDPAAALGRLRGWMAPGALLVVAVPNLSSLQARVGGDRWFHQDVPRHRTHFTASGAAAILERSGFEVERTHHLLVEQNALGMWQTLLNRLTSERDVAYRACKRDPALRNAPRRDLLVSAVGGAVLAPVAILLELLAGAARRGGSIGIEASAR